MKWNRALTAGEVRVLVGVLVVSLVHMTLTAADHAELARRAVDSFWTLDRLFTALVKVCTQ